MEMNLSLSQKQVLSQRMQLSARILQMNSLDLEQYIHEAALENPMIDFDILAEPEDPMSVRLKKLEWLNAIDESNSFSVSYNYNEKENTQPLYEKKTVDSLEDTLLIQLPGFLLPSVQERAVRYLISALDGNGYLSMPRRQLLDESGIDEATLEAAINVLQHMDPPGVGARDLRECLLIQVQRMDEPSPILIQLISDHLGLLAKNQLSKIAKAMNISIKEVKQARSELLMLNPKPGNGYSGYNDIPYIHPDIFIVHFEGTFQLVLNDYKQPRIFINSEYLKIAKDSDSEAVTYIRDKLRAAEWLVNCVNQRKDTILKCAEQIMKWQLRFFEQGPGNIVPMTLADIAAPLEMHPSTISRAVSGKYLQCQWGVFALSELFSRPVGDTCSEKSQDMIMMQIKRIISEEDHAKPFSDQKLADLLQEHDMPVARRTVTKYREAMGIPPANKRKVF